MPNFKDDPVISRNRFDDPQSKLSALVRGLHDVGLVGRVGDTEVAREITRVDEMPTIALPDDAEPSEPAVRGEGDATGIVGVGRNWHGVYGKSESEIGGHGVSGEGVVGVGGVGLTWVGVYGETRAAPGAGSCGVLGEGQSGGIGVKGHARAPGQAGVAGYQLANEGPGVYGEGAPAGYFKGDVVVTGDVVLEGADYAEELTAAAADVGPGMVVVLDEEGRIAPCDREYDPRVAGIVSGAGGVRPGIVLDRHDGGAPVALMGKLWTLADATEAPIRCADQLTTSATRGHARRVTERQRAFGAVIGKALTELPSGRGLVRVLVSAN